jgi:hypothetical protein
MSEAFRLQQIVYNAESSFAEYAATPDSATYDTKIPFKSATLTLNQDMIEGTTQRERLASRNMGNVGVRTASLEFTTNWVGHGGTAAGSLTQTWLQDLLSDGLGGGSTSDQGTTISGGSSTVTALDVTSAANITVGNAVRVGSKGDGKGDGQLGIVSAFDTAATPDDVTLITALPAAPADTNVVYACQVAYHDESAVTTLGTKRFMVYHATTGAQFGLFGGQLAGLTFNLPLDNALPEITWRYEFAYWDRDAETYPETNVAMGTEECAPLAGGSAFIQAVGTATRATVTPAQLALTVDLGLSPIYGPGGVGTYQNITGWSRTGCAVNLSMAIPWVTTYGDWWDTDTSSITYKHFLFTGNAVDGRSVGFYCPRLKPMGNRPIGVENVNDQNYVRVNFAGDEGPTTTTELTRSAIRFFSC